jgi:anti-sigma-K factor RskA
MTEHDDKDMQAAEYVLGTLDPAERNSVAARRLRETDLDAAITVWEQRLAPLNDYVDGAAPAPDLFDRIRRETGDETATGLPAAAPPAELHRLRRHLAGWRAAAIGAVAIAASLLVAIGTGYLPAPRDDRNFVAVFQQGDAPPSFLMSIDLQTRELTIRPVAAEPQPGKSYQLWILAKELGPVPLSLGLLEPPTGPTRKALAEYDPATLRSATFGISVEPEGGSPTGRPTGPALHGTLHPTAL